MLYDTNYKKFKMALHRLEERYSDFLQSATRLELLDSDREAIEESCIQRFETCFDTLWKHLKKYLQEDSGLLDIPSSPRPIFRIAVEHGIINNYETWHLYTQRRNDAANEYLELNATEAISIIPDFIPDAIHLYEKMTGEKWEKIYS